MGRPTKIFLHFLTDKDGNSYYCDEANNVQKGRNVWLNHSPKEWREQVLTWGRNTTYYGYNRSFTSSYSFVEDGAAILRYLMYGQAGVEEKVYLVVLKWNPDSDVYEDYYKAEVDFSQFQDSPQTDFKVGLFEGGLPKIIKAYENTQFTIPMDGSLLEHYKVNIDGILFDDIYHYVFVPGGIPTNGPDFGVIATVFIGNDGDSIGVHHNDQQYDYLHYHQGTNIDLQHFLDLQQPFFYSEQSITVRVKGFITVTPVNVAQAPFSLGYTTDKTVNLGYYNGQQYQQFIVPKISTYVQGTTIINVEVQSQTTFSFDFTVTLQAGERLYLTNSDAGDLVVVNGSFDATFSSRYRATQPWALSMRDTFQILLKNICDYANYNDSQEIYDYETVSTLLDSFKGFSLTSGDALRASADPNYAKFFNPVSQNGAQNAISNYTSYGPVMRTSLKDLFNAANCILNASMGTGFDANGKQIAFLENKGYVFNSSTVDDDLGEVAAMQISLATDNVYDSFKIGYPAQQYDEKAGKYEYNTTLSLRAPITQVQNELNLVCPYRADSYGIEYTRFNATKDAKSTTYNNSDGSVFLLNADRSKFKYDSGAAQTEGRFTTIKGRIEEEVPLTKLTGTYLSLRNDNAIFVWRRPSVNEGRTFRVTYAGQITGRVDDTVRIEMWYNGAILDSYTETLVTNQKYIGGSVNGRTVTIPQAFSQNDAWFFRVFCSATANVVFSDATGFTIDTNFFIANIVGIQTVAPGSMNALLNFDSGAPTKETDPTVVNYGFDYLFFNESIASPLFNLSFSAIVDITGSQQVFVRGFVNGVPKYSLSFIGAAAQQTLNQTLVFPQNFQFGDLLWALYDNAGSATCDIVNASFSLNSKQIKVHNLARGNYSLIVGVPNPATAYNIEQLTPRRMLNRHGDWIRASLFQQQNQTLKYLGLDKNESLATVWIDGTQVYSERGDELISDLDDPLFLPYVFEFKTRIPETFAKTMYAAANKHIKFQYNGISFYGFPIKVSVQPALNESQTWQLLASPMNKLTDLIDLSLNGINYLQLTTLGMTAPHLNPVQFVPLNVVFDARYNFRHMDQDWFINQVNAWSARDNYAQKWQLNDTVKLQVITNGLGPVQMDVLDCSGKTVAAGVAFNQMASQSVQSPYILYQLEFPLSQLPGEGGYYYVITAGVGGTVAQVISELQQVALVQDNTMLVEYSNVRNKQTMIFDNGFMPGMRIEAKLIRMNPAMNQAAYEDEPADEYMLSGIPYRKFTLFVGGGVTGIPPYMIDKLNRIMGLNTVVFDGIEYTRSGDANFERQSTPGQALEFWSIEVRQSKNTEGVTVNADGTLENNLFAVYNLETKQFGDISGAQVSSNVVQVTKLED